MLRYLRMGLVVREGSLDAVGWFEAVLSAIPGGLGSGLSSSAVCRGP